MVFVSVRGSRPGKNVQLSESEIKSLCVKSREIFLSQPILLELEAPLKICGMYFNGIHLLPFVVDHLKDGHPSTPRIQGYTDNARFNVTLCLSFTPVNNGHFIPSVSTCLRV